MRFQTVATILGVGGLVGALACVTINVYFPEAAVKELAAEIEDAVEDRAKAATPADGAEAPAANASVTGWLAALALGTPVYADEVPGPAVSNPAIRKIVESRAKRLPQLADLKAKGVIGEGRDASVVIRGLDALGLKERAEAQKLVKAENEDREAMFKEMAAETGVDLSQLARIREAYAETLREKARPGEWIELPDGTWQAKK